MSAQTNGSDIRVGTNVYIRERHRYVGGKVGEVVEMETAESGLTLLNVLVKQSGRGVGKDVSLAREHVIPLGSWAEGASTQVQAFVGEMCERDTPINVVSAGELDVVIEPQEPGQTLGDGVFLTADKHQFITRQVNRGKNGDQVKFSLS